MEIYSKYKYCHDENSFFDLCLWRERSYEFISVRECVCPSVGDAKISELAHLFFFGFLHEVRTISDQK